MELVLVKLELEPRPAIRWPGAGSAVSVDRRVASRDFCRNGYRPATLLLPMLSSLWQQLPEEERRSWRFRPKKIVTTAFTTSGVGCRWLLPGDGAGCMARTFS